MPLTPADILEHLRERGGSAAILAIIDANPGAIRSEVESAAQPLLRNLIIRRFRIGTIDYYGLATEDGTVPRTLWQRLDDELP